MASSPPGTAAAALVLAIAGCNQVLGLDPTSLADDEPDAGEVADAAAAVDSAPRPDAPPDAPPCTPGVVTASAEADAIVIANSATNYGQLEVCNVSAGLGSIGLFRFDVGAVPAGATITGITLSLPYAPTSNACGTGCGSCAFIDAAGMFAVAWMRSDWNEATTDWFEGWSQAGASGPLDRSEIVATGVHDDDADTEVALSPAQIGLWRAGTKLSVQVVPGAGTAIVVAAREKPSLETCAPAVPPASLQIEFCEP